MRIASFQTRLASPAKEMDPVRDGPGAAHGEFSSTLQLRTDDGIEGIGYAGFVGQEMLGSLKEAVDALAQHAIGDDPLDVEAIGAKLLEWGGKGAPAGTITRAVAAIDVALWDIKGKALGQPVYKLLGGFRDRIATYASGFLWRTYDASALAETGARLVEEGFRAMKFRMGAEDSAAAEVTRMKVLREAVGDGIDLMVDINQAWDVNRSIAVGREMEKVQSVLARRPHPSSGLRRAGAHRQCARHAYFSGRVSLRHSAVPAHARAPLGGYRDDRPASRGGELRLG